MSQALLVFWAWHLTTYLKCTIPLPHAVSVRTQCWLWASPRAASHSPCQCLPGELATELKPLTSRAKPVMFPGWGRDPGSPL